MKPEFAKQWTKELEQPLYEAWKQQNVHRFDKRTSKKVFSIDTPPPYVNTPVHIGQATTYVLMDMFARYRRMKGYEVLFPLGLDRNGLPIEMAAERKFNIKLTETPREQFIDFCKKVLEEASESSTESFLKLGISFNSWHLGKEPGDVYHTDSPEYRAVTQATFIDMFKKELIYEDERINNWCPGCQTTLADAEVEYEDLPSFFNDIIFTVKETGEKIIIGTTRPELVCTCGMVIFNPEDERYRHLDGKIAITPLFNKEVPIRAHPAAQIDKGTGIVMMCSAGDLSDIRFFRDMGISPVIAINKDGTMNKHAGFLDGLSVKEAQKKMVTELDKRKLLVHQKRTTHRTPICERSKDPIEFISMTELYVKQMDFKEDMRKLAAQLNFFADDSRQILLNWIDSVSIDWPISRRRYYATEVPLWHQNKLIALPPKGKYYAPWKEQPPADADVYAFENGMPKKKGTINDFPGKWIGDVRVFDTWFDSSISPLYILMYERDEEFFKKHQPCSLRPQGKEIIRTWLYYTVLKDYLLTGKCIFNDVWINYHIVDDKGEKMSKSKGNVISPKTILDKFGAEPFRLWSAVEGNLERTDFRCSAERIEGAGKTINKLWNVAKFIAGITSEEFSERIAKETYEQLFKSIPLTATDEWIISEVNKLITLADERYAQYDFHNPAIATRNFIWEAFASHYLELVKGRAYNTGGQFTNEQQEAALLTLNYCLDTLLAILCPVVPFITEKIFMTLHGNSVHTLTFPEVLLSVEPTVTTKDITEVNSAIWKTKKDEGASLMAEVVDATLPKSIEPILHDLIVMHKIKKWQLGSETYVLVKK
ncbi:MAG: valine--tRNA ligase [archaeon]